MKKYCILSYPLSTKCRLWLDFADARRSLRLTHMTFCCCFLCCGSNYYFVYTINGRICRLLSKSERERERECYSLFTKDCYSCFTKVKLKQRERERMLFLFYQSKFVKRERERERERERVRYYSFSTKVKISQEQVLLSVLFQVNCVSQRYGLAKSLSWNNVLILNFCLHFGKKGCFLLLL